MSKSGKKLLHRQKGISDDEIKDLPKGHLSYPMEGLLYIKKDLKGNDTIERHYTRNIATVWIKLEEIKNNCQAIEDYCSNMGFKFICNGKKYGTNFKLVVGLGEQSVMENSITIHYTYGIPYIPAQAIKGVMRSYLHNYSDEIFESCNKIEQKILEMILFGVDRGSNQLDTVDLSEKTDEMDEIIKVIGKGSVIFFDAFPHEKYTLEKDVMCPHNKKYYEDNKGTVAPKDTENPVPLFFYTVSDTMFKIYIALNVKRLEKIRSLLKPKYKNIYKLLKDEIESKLNILLGSSLENDGIGAKTAVGYGSLYKIV